MRRLIVSFAAVAVLLAVAMPADASNDPLFNQQWNLERTNTPAAWTATTGGGVRVGIVDTGIDAGHQDLQGRIAASTACTPQCGGNPNDTNGHGTHVAGIVAANKDNGVGVAGVAPGATLVIARVFDGGGNTSLDAVNAGADWAVANGARIVNFSLGGTGLLGLGLFNSNNEIIAIANRVWNAGAIPVIAAGNGSCASWAGIAGVVVASTGPSDEQAGFSCSAASAPNGIGAPGGNGNCDAGCPLSTYKNNGYAYIAGTSQATPVVAGALALLLAQGNSREAAIGRLMSTADSIGCGACAGRRVNVGRAVCGACTPAAPPATTGPTTPPPRPVTPTTRSVTRPVTQVAGGGAATTTTVSPGEPGLAIGLPEETTTTAETTTSSTTKKQKDELAAKNAKKDGGLPRLPAAVAALGLIGAVAGITAAGVRQRVRVDAKL